MRDIRGNEVAITEGRLHPKKTVIPQQNVCTQSLSNARRQIRNSEDSAWHAEYWESQRQN